VKNAAVHVAPKL